MRRWLDWQFALPRVMAIAVALLGVQYVLGVVARSVAIQAGEEAMGPGFTVGHARVSPLDRRVVFDGLRVVNERHPSENVLAADRCELKFAATPVLHKQVVVEEGRISGLRFNGFKGAARDAKSAAKAGASSEFLKSDTDLAARKWLDRLNGQFTLDAVKDFDSVTRTETFCSNWSKCSAELESNLKDLDGRAAELQKAIELAEANPLRNDKLLEELGKRQPHCKKNLLTLALTSTNCPKCWKRDAGQSSLRAGKTIRPSGSDCNLIPSKQIRCRPICCTTRPPDS